MILNRKYRTRPKIAHNPAKGAEINPQWDKIVQCCQTLSQGSIPNNLTVITWNNQQEKGMAEQSLDRMGIPYVCLGRGEVWKGNNDKLELFANYHNKIKTKYILGLDCYDVLIIGDLINILDDFLQTGAKLLFNATPRNYPPTDYYVLQDKILCPEGPFHHLNSGVFIGETDYIKGIFEEAWQNKCCFISTSDQGAIKPIYHREYPNIQIDWQCHLFQVVLKEIDLLVVPRSLL